jgi:hypothetical protein
MAISISVIGFRHSPVETSNIVLQPFGNVVRIYYKTKKILNRKQNSWLVPYLLYLLRHVMCCVLVFLTIKYAHKQNIITTMNTTETFNIVLQPFGNVVRIYNTTKHLLKEIVLLKTILLTSSMANLLLKTLCIGVVCYIPFSYAHHCQTITSNCFYQKYQLRRQTDSISFEIQM